MTSSKIRPFAAIVLAMAISVSAAPAYGVVLPSDAAEVPASPVEGENSGIAPSLESEAPGNSIEDTPETPPDPAPEQSPAVESSPGMAEPPPSDTAAPGLPPEPEPIHPVDPSSLSEEDLEEIIGILGAKMGQGLERIEETQDPQQAGAEETKLRLDAEQELIEEGIADPDLASPPEAADADPAAADAPHAGAPAAALYSQEETSVSLAATWQPSGLQGMDVSSHQPSVNWGAAWNQGARFAYAKATEATSYKNPLFSSQYNGAGSVGMVRGAYHFAIPNVSSGAVQANYFVDNGGGWSADGNTLPPLLDIEYNPYPELGNTCYSMSADQMVGWIRDFSNTLAARTGRLPMIYTTTDWWRTCTGNSSAFANQPLHIASYNTTAAGALPSGWGNYTLWQYSSTGPFPGDSNVYNGSLQQLRSFARQTSVIQPGQLYYRGNPVTGLAYGNSSDQFLTCDWDGDGTATPAAFRNGTWYIRNSLTGNSTVTELSYGDPGDQPICGDWDGDGKDTIGVFRQGMVYLKNRNTSGMADGVFAFGDSTDVALVGDWDGDGYDTLGVARAEGPAKRFYLSNSNIRPTVAGSFLYGNAGDNAVAGDWNNDGNTTVGVQRGNTWHLSNSNLRPVANSTFAFGNAGDRPITGSWARGQGTSVGVTR